MSARLMVPGLAHRHPGVDDAEFFAQIDAHGGWPIGYSHVGFEHTSERSAGFCNSPSNDGWWTVLASADDYYLWKLSPVALQRIADAVVASIWVPRVDAKFLSIRNSLGRQAELAKAAEARS